MSKLCLILCLACLGCSGGRDAPVDSIVSKGDGEPIEFRVFIEGPMTISAENDSNVTITLDEGDHGWITAVVTSLRVYRAKPPVFEFRADTIKAESIRIDSIPGGAWDDTIEVESTWWVESVPARQ